MAVSAVSVHERLLDAAGPLFLQRGIRQISKEEVQRVAGVSGSEFDREFSSRDDLATEYFERREQAWVDGILEADARARATTPEGRLLAIFDVFGEWFHRDDYEALSRVDSLLQMGSGHPLGHANVGYLLNLRDLAASLATEARLSQPLEFALSWHVLVTGAIVNAIEGDEDAASRAKEMARGLIARHQPNAIHARADSFDEPDGFDLDAWIDGFPAWPA